MFLLLFPAAENLLPAIDQDCFIFRLAWFLPFFHQFQGFCFQFFMKRTSKKYHAKFCNISTLSLSSTDEITWIGSVGCFHCPYSTSKIAQPLFAIISSKCTLCSSDIFKEPHVP